MNLSTKQVKSPTLWAGVFKLYPLSPVHIGSGEKLSGVDLNFSQPGIMIVNDIHKYIAESEVSLEQKEKIIDTGAGSKIPLEFARYAISRDFSPTAQNTRGRGGKEPAMMEVREFLKSIHNKPFIPGSSLKGAIRTALAWKLFDPENNKHLNALRNGFGKKPEHAGGDLDALLFSPYASRGNEPNLDICSFIHISDSAPISSKYLSAVECKTFSLSGASGTLNPKIYSIYIEALSRADEPGIYCVDFPVKLVPPLRERDGNVQFSNEWHNLFDTPEKLLAVLREHSIEIVKREIAFFTKYQLESADHTPKKFYEALLAQLENGETLLCFGFGAGWDKMTIGPDKIPDNLFKELRSRHRLGHAHIANLPYPKSRRLVMGGDSFLPLGWARLEFHGAQALHDIQWQLQEEDSGTMRILKARQQSLSSRAPAQSAKPPHQENWPKALIQYTPNNGLLTAVNSQDQRKAEINIRNLDPTERDRLLTPLGGFEKVKKKKEFKNTSVEVRVEGNMLTIVGILAS